VVGTTAGQTNQWEQLRQAYAPVDPTTPSFLRFQYVKYNSISKSRDLGTYENLLVSVDGSIGGQSGAGTLYFKVNLVTPARLGIRLVNADPQTSRWVSVGLLDSNHKPIDLDVEGFALPPLIPYGDGERPNTVMPVGTYYFTISSSQWSSRSFQLELAVIGYTSLEGAMDLALPSDGRLGMARPEGVMTLEDRSEGTIPPMAILKQIDGVQSGTLEDGGSYLALFAGVAGFQLQGTGRFSTFFYIDGLIPTALQLEGDLQVTRPYGGY
jgi:hypothetical protein